MYTKARSATVERAERAFLSLLEPRVPYWPSARVAVSYRANLRKNRCASGVCLGTPRDRNTIFRPRGRALERSSAYPHPDEGTLDRGGVVLVSLAEVAHRRSRVQQRRLLFLGELDGRLKRGFRLRGGKITAKADTPSPSATAYSEQTRTTLCFAQRKAAVGSSRRPSQKNKACACSVMHSAAQQLQPHETHPLLLHKQVATWRKRAWSTTRLTAKCKPRSARGKRTQQKQHRPRITRPP